MHKNELTLVDIKEGFIRGNIFKELDQPYKNYTGVKPPINNERDADMVRLMAVSLYAQDLHLYLDVYPDDTEKFKLFKKYQLETNRLTKEYEQKYGSISLGGVGEKWDWVAFPAKEERL